MRYNVITLPLREGGEMKIIADIRIEITIEKGKPGPPSEPIKGGK